MTTLKVAVFAGGLSWPIYIAEDQGFFTKHGLDVRVTEIPDSVKQIQGLASQTYDVIMTPFDNVVAYQEGQGEVPLGHDAGMFAFMGGINACLRLLTKSDVKTFEELKGTTIGIDAEHTGYTLAMYQMLAQHDVPLGSYSLSKTGGTSFRVKALAEGKIAATMVSSPQEIVPEENGFRQLGDVLSMIGAYQAVCGVACRSWATQADETLQAFIRAYVGATDWLSSRDNLEAATNVYLHHISGASRDLVLKAWTMMIGGKEGFQAKAKFDPVGAETVLRIRSHFGVPAKTLSPWQTFVDESFYTKALQRKA